MGAAQGGVSDLSSAPVTLRWSSGQGGAGEAGRGAQAHQ